MQTRVVVAAMLMTCGTTGLAVLLGVRPAPHPTAHPEFDLTVLFVGALIAVLVGGMLFWRVGVAVARFRAKMRRLTEFHAGGVALHEECMKLGEDGEVDPVRERADVWDDEVTEWVRHELPSYFSVLQMPSNVSGASYDGLSREASRLAWGLNNALHALDEVTRRYAAEQ